jgi:hypothetical protein
MVNVRDKQVKTLRAGKNPSQSKHKRVFEKS